MCQSPAESVSAPLEERHMARVAVVPADLKQSSGRASSPSASQFPPATSQSALSLNAAVPKPE